MSEEKPLKKKKVVRKKSVKQTESKVEPNLPVQLVGTGRRKTAVARVRLLPGSGEIKINGKDLQVYCSNRLALMALVRKPLEVTGTLDKYDIAANLGGGGVAAQITALAHGLSRALLIVNPDFKSILRKNGLLTRDPRMKERKKYGHKRARKSFQYSKR